MGRVNPFRTLQLIILAQNPAPSFWLGSPAPSFWRSLHESSFWRSLPESSFWRSLPKSSFWRSLPESSFWRSQNLCICSVPPKKPNSGPRTAGPSHTLYTSTHGSSLDPVAL
jgi:hypothetical protein